MMNTELYKTATNSVGQTKPTLNFKKTLSLKSCLRYAQH